MRLRKSLSVLAMVIGIAAFTGSTASADPAVVFNHGNNPGDNCLLSGLGSTYVGFVTFVTNDNGGVVHCTLRLTSGPGAHEVVKGDGFITVFAGKIATLTNQL